MPFPARPGDGNDNPCHFPRGLVTEMTIRVISRAGGSSKLVAVHKRTDGRARAAGGERRAREPMPRMQRAGNVRLATGSAVGPIVSHGHPTLVDGDCAAVP